MPMAALDLGLPLSDDEKGFYCPGGQSIILRTVLNALLLTLLGGDISVQGILAISPPHFLLWTGKFANLPTDLS